MEQNISSTSDHHTCADGFGLSDSILSAIILAILVRESLLMLVGQSESSSAGVVIRS